ncbi:MAG: hypothetical protein WBC92_13025, partial [Terracidiphilus sp.]
YKHWPEPSFKRISTGQRRKAQGNPLQYGEFQRVPRRHPHPALTCPISASLQVKAVNAAM